MDSDRKRIDELARNRDLLTKRMMQAGQETQMQEALVKVGPGKQVQHEKIRRVMISTGFHFVFLFASFLSALFQMHENQQRTLESEIAGYREENAKQRKHIMQLERDRDRNINEAAAAQAKSLEVLEQARVAETEIMDLKKKLADTDSKLRQQQR